jgi:hypothetical protein
METQDCDSCARTKRLAAEPGAFEIHGHAPTIVVAGPEAVTGDIRIKVDAPGSSSEARLSPAGTVSLVVKGAEGVGRLGEARVTRMLTQYLLTRH